MKIAIFFFSMTIGTLLATEPTGAKFDRETVEKNLKQSNADPIDTVVELLNQQVKTKAKMEKLKAENKQYKACAIDLDKAKTKEEQIQATVNQLAKDKQACDETVQTKEAELKAEKAKNKKLPYFEKAAAKAEQTQQAFETAQATIKTLQQEKQQLHDTLAEQAPKIQEVATLNVQLANTKKQIETLNKDLTHETAMKTECVTAREEFQKQAHTTSLDLKKSLEELQIYKQQKEEWEKGKVALEQCKTIQNTVKNLQQEAVTKQAQLEQISAKQTEYEEKASLLERQNNALKEELAHAKTQPQQSSAHTELVMGENKHLKALLEQAKGQLAILMKQLMQTQQFLPKTGA